MIGPDCPLPDPAARFGFVVRIEAPSYWPAATADLLRSLVRRQAPLVVTGVSRDDLADWRQTAIGLAAELPPDVVVFDESFVNRDVPFGAFTASKTLFDRWNRRGDPHSIPRRFSRTRSPPCTSLKCLEAGDPAFWAGLQGEFEHVLRDPTHCLARLGQVYSPFLAKAIRALGLDTPRASRRLVTTSSPTIGRSSTASPVSRASIRGHNPDSYLAELERWDDTPDLHAAVTDKLKAATGLDHLLPAVSGASARGRQPCGSASPPSPRNRTSSPSRAGSAARHCSPSLALPSRCTSNTSTRCTRTSCTSTRSRRPPLPILRSRLAKYPVAVVQIELIQAVGGIRSVPP